MGFRNPMKNLADMEKYLVETCADLDYTAVKACFGKGQNETGLKNHFLCNYAVPITKGDQKVFGKLL